MNDAEKAEKYDALLARALDMGDALDSIAAILDRTERGDGAAPPTCPECSCPLVDATGDWQCHPCGRLWPADFFDGAAPPAPDAACSKCGWLASVIDGDSLCGAGGTHNFGAAPPSSPNDETERLAQALYENEPDNESGWRWLDVRLDEDFRGYYRRYAEALHAALSGQQDTTECAP